MRGARSRSVLQPICAAALGGLISCGSDDIPFVPGGSAAPTAPSARTRVDRLEKGELAEGSTRVFGFTFPRKLKVKHKAPKAVHARGQVAPEDVSNYVRKRVSAAHVEVGAARTVFPTVRMQGDTSGKLYRVEVIRKRRGLTELVIRDITAPPVPQGLSEAERWKRAGMKPDGTPIDPKSLE